LQFAEQVVAMWRAALRRLPEGNNQGFKKLTA